MSKALKLLAGFLKNFFNVAIVLLTVGCTSMDSGVLFPNDELQEISTSSHSFVPFVPETYDYSLASGEVNVTYGSGIYKDSSLLPSTDKYKIEEYGFFQITAVGLHNGQNRNLDEQLPPQPWDQLGTVKRADINGDGWEDFYYVEAWEGSRDDQPEAHLMAFLNNGNGQFRYSPDVFAGGISPCIGYADFDFKTDPNHSCGFVSHWQRSIVTDFNGDGIDDFYKTSILHLSNGEGVIENKSSNLPLFQFQMWDNQFGDLTGAWTHDNYAGDVDGDGDLDIFGMFTDESVGWTMLINDGSGIFSANHNFSHDPNLWASTGAIGDFNNDGYGDIAVAWFNPDESSGAVFWNDGNNDWRIMDSTLLPANFYATNGNANDMEVMDFNNDGFLDILLASTTHEPYYAGRAIQFFVNGGDNTFSEWTSFESGSGDGELQLLDFDGDGDIDIVDVVENTYVLVNEGDSFVIYDNFPTNGLLFPVEIDSKWQYDFISYEMIYTGNDGTDDTSVTTFFQVLDPPTQILKDITNKPASYALTASENKLIFSNLRYRQLDGESDITITNNNMLGFDVERGNLHLGMGYARNERKAQNETVYFGASSAVINIETYTVYAESFWKKIRFGLAYYLTEVDSFHERGSQFDMEIDSFTLQDIELFADIRYKGFSLGISKYASVNDTAIGLQRLKYKHNHKTTMMRASYLKKF